MIKLIELITVVYLTVYIAIKLAERESKNKWD